MKQKTGKFKMSDRKLTRSYLHAPGKLPFIGRTIGQQLYVSAEEYQDKEMYVFYKDDERISFAEMKEKVERIGNYSIIYPSLNVMT